MDFIKMYTAKLNMQKLINACERHYHWEQAVFLYMHYDEYDSAANTMMQHSSTAFSHDQFLMVMQKVSNMEIYYRAISFYLDEQPMLVCSLLNTITPKVDHARVVQQIRKAGHLPLVLPYLKQVQPLNIAVVNEGINDLYVEGEQHEDLRHSIEDFDNFDQVALAQRLEKHEIVEMRRIAALIYKKNKRFKQSIELSKTDRMFKDAMETARDSAHQETAENLLRYFIESGSSECFCACLYTCYDLIRPDVALELAWRNNMTDFAMPYLIQTIREYTGRIDSLTKKTEQKEEAEEKQKSASNDYVPDYMMPAMMPGGLPGMGNLAIMGPTPAMQPQMQPTMQMGGGMGPSMPVSMGPGGMQMQPNMGGMGAW
jgi:clathrin heavy chain